MFGKKKKQKHEKHGKTIKELLNMTEQLDNKLSDMGLCSHDISVIAMFLQQANSPSGGSGVQMLGGVVDSEGMKEILKKIAEKMEKGKDDE